jgi:DivIVA domain-containing protein
MDDDRIAVSSGFVVTPETVASRTFATSFRGFDQGEVRTFLKRVSEELAAAAEREAHLRRLLQDALNKAAHPEVDESVLTAALGEHAARLLGSAREEAASIRAEAETKAARMLRDAENQISRIRSEADGLLARRVEEVDGVTANLRNAAEADARALREKAKADVEAEIQAAKAQGREMVTEARTIRERILADLARRRHIAEVQLDQLRAARERLLEAYSVVRRTLDEGTKELKMAEVEARLAAEEAARRAGPPPPPPPPPSPPRTDLDVGPQTGEHEAVPEPAGSPPPPTGPPPAGAPEPAPVGAGAPSPQAPALPARGGSTRLRSSRETQARPDPRLRPPSRPDESRPSQRWRRPGSGEPAGHPEGHEAGAPAERLLSRTSPAPEPPSITPRPVPPPPARRVGPPAPSPETGATPPPPEPSASEPASPERPAPEEGDRVEAIFARIKADRASVVAKTSRTAAPSPETVVAPPASEETASSPRPPTADQGKEISDEFARDRRDELLEPYESMLVRQLKRALQDEQNEVLDKLRRQRRPTGASVFPSHEEQVNRFRRIASPALADAARAGARFAGVDAPSDPSEADIGASVASALASAVVEPLRARLDRQLTGGGDGDGPPDDAAQLGESISAAYRQWRAQELEPLARHHAADAFGRGAYAGYSAGTALRWVVDDETPCPDCDDNALAGSVAKGEPYPTGQAHPPAHPGCRCLLVPAVP